MPTALFGTEDPPGGGDTDLAFDHTGKQYFADLYALACFRMATTSDDGASVQQSVFPGGCAGSPDVDRQWFAMFDPPGGVTQSAYRGPFPLLYMEYNHSGASWVKSTDGLNFTAAGTTPCCPDGYPSLDQVTGDVLQVDADRAGDLALNIGTPDSTGNLTFPASPSVVVPAAWMKAHGTPDDLFPVSTLDRARNLYVLFVTENPTNPAEQQIWATAASARSGWRTWSAPVQVSDGSLKTGDAVNVMPWIKAGAAGLADAVWYGSGPGSNGKIADANADMGQAWNVFMSQLHWPVDSSGAVITSRRPALTLTRVTQHPMHYNDICEHGTGCIEVQGNRNLADFFNLTFDSQGAAVIVYDDTSNQLLQPGAPTTNQALDHAGAAVVTIARQVAGMGVYGHSVGGTPATSSRQAGAAVAPGVDVTQSGVSLSGDRASLRVTMKVADLTNLASPASAVRAPVLSYVTRWVMHGGGQDTIYYAEMETDASGAAPQFYAGAAQSVDLCSVSACSPHVITYPETGSVSGSLDCSSKPCTISISVPASMVGSPAAGSKLEEIGSYAFAESHPMAATTNVQAQADNVPLEVGGVCCYEYQQASPAAAGRGGAMAEVMSAVAGFLGIGGKGSIATGGQSGSSGSTGPGGSGAPEGGGSTPGGQGPGAGHARAPGGSATVRSAPAGAIAGGAAIVVLALGLAGWYYANRRTTVERLPAFTATPPPAPSEEEPPPPPAASPRPRRPRPRKPKDPE
jgi:hypothetical protein